MSRRIALFILFVFALFLFTLWTLVKFNDAYNILTKDTQLSAWALAQVEIETLEFTHQGEKYLISDSVTKHDLNLSYDILWNRYDTFLHSAETHDVRTHYNSGNVVEEAFTILQKYEKGIAQGDKEQVARLLSDIEQVYPKIRNLLLINFTGLSSVENRALIAENRQTVFIDMALIMVVLAFFSIRLYRDSKHQQFITWHDPLTKLKNRNYLLSQLKCLSDSKQKHAVVLLDIRHFKDINDTVSYEYGDKVLCEVAAQIKRKADKFEFSCARVGADQFAVIADKYDVDFEFFIKSLLNDLNDTLPRLDRSKRMRISMGVATCQDAIDSNEQYPTKFDTVLNNADFALNIAKKIHSQQIVFFSRKIALEHRKKKKLSDQLAKLISSSEQKQLYLAFQPIVPRQNDRLGCEALIRWNHPEYGQINPEYLIQIAEESGIAKDLGRWIFLQVQQALAIEWREFRHRIEVAVNLSDSLFDEELPQLVLETLGTVPNFLDSIVLEITETMTLDDIERSNNIISSLEKLNVRLALDDFGTGWSSLYNLNHLNFSKLKIDKSFVQNLGTKSNQTFFISAIVTLSHQLGIKVVAEGIEDASQLRSLMALGVDEFQGYYFSKPIPQQEFSLFCEQYFTQHPLTLNALTTL
ncbi:MAG: EAL domain-containing protein [Vibrionaceae bacterium]|nr:EAL domain-containing protein [Vibrionaceae bacterium]